MSRQYEIVYIFDSALDEGQVDERLAKFHALLQTPEHPEPVTATNHWGKRTLAYPIGRKETGYYVVVQFDAAADQLPEFERAIKLDESVLRHLVVLNEGVTTAAAVAAERDERDRDRERDRDAESDA
jgi:small subunit ribosomal protein S6